MIFEEAIPAQLNIGGDGIMETFEGRAVETMSEEKIDFIDERRD
ncbi:predicted protein [Sclerotinia sclerotiorum 1980 UF-70]|uniref:Uncharacterized protein n=1 Tax=Sclerotinia sclerotiorum (strain ATCC 18683 / 1980 / Ss-1) TaxID=665079 RepID=A7EMU7_SCLS1|nr:predicted protein [Sclerotinia sclerotiorum 1980 UF-70]EDO04163.1 predicted protein [Sclerotinia sclerotiorum 1980 UF-70]